MKSTRKSQSAILSKLGIEALNEMQEQAALAIDSVDEVILLSPTGSGKTLAFLLPLIAILDEDIPEVQAMIIVPSRELAIQIEQVARDMGSGYKINTVYGGRPFSKDKMELAHTPHLIIGTPGRLADHMRRGTFSTEWVKTLILDEFDKSLEIGFEEEMDEIIYNLPNAYRKILTSATQGVDIPDFVDLKKPMTIDYLADGVKKLDIKAIISPDKDKLDTLVTAIRHLGNQPAIVFLNFKDAIDRVSDHLDDCDIPHGCFYGGLDQHDRERALLKFRNGTHQLLIATDLAARGIDVPEIKFIIHYHLPIREEEFTHRNGRTARMHSDGTAYVLHWKDEELPDFIYGLPEEKLTENHKITKSVWTTLFISGGRKDKISKGDIAGLFFKIGKLKKDQLGIIELKSDCAFVAVSTSALNSVLQKVDNQRVKKKKVRIYTI
ncbi:MAG: DEAD/DEAH box helicase [Saprospiraceae bacterium]|jgi:superfamily II DNA/RNA helicase|tara:strand:- start:1570 stop:2880 length:1311 start_codon:yes stop_codon:yes gene_type:complete